MYIILCICHIVKYLSILESSSFLQKFASSGRDSTGPRAIGFQFDIRDRPTNLWRTAQGWAPVSDRQRLQELIRENETIYPLVN